MKKELSKILAKKAGGIVLSVAIVLSAMLPAVVSAATAEDFTNVFDVYYSSDLRTVTPTPEALSGHWALTSDTTRLKRSTADSNWQSYGPNMAMLYLKDTYENFELTTVFSRPNGDGLQTYFGIGAPKVAAWSEDSDSYVFGFHQSGGLMWGRNGNWITGGGQTPADKISGYASEGVHTLRLRVLDKVYTAWVDDIQVGTGTLAKYSGGYIWFGADDMTASWGIPEIKKLNAAADFTNVFDVYYSSDLRTVTPTPEALSGHWALTSDTTRLKRSTADSNWQSYGPNMAMLYLKDTYENFELTTVFSRPNGDGLQTYFGIGAPKAAAWSEDSDSYVFGFHQSGGLMWGRNGGWITGGGQTPADKISGYASEGVHTLRLRVLDKVYTAWVDDIPVGTGTLAKYSGGYIWFGADDMTASWGIPEIQELVSTSVLSAYYTENAKTNESMTATALADYWKADGDLFMRNDRSVNWNTSYNNLSVVYLNTRKYKSFEMTVQYRVYQGSNHNNSTLIGFGATEMGKSFYFDTNAVACNISKYGAICSADTGAASYWYKGGGSTLHDTVAGWDDLAQHTLTVRVADGTVLYTIDGHTVFGQTLTHYAQEGYIFFASNELTTRFGIPTVRELTDTDASDNADSPLYGKKALFVGDSISYGAGDDIFGLSWGGRVGIRYGMDWQNRSVSGSTVMEAAGIPRIIDQLTDGAFDYVVLEGGINDALKSHPLGTISDSFAPEDFDTDTFGGAFEELLYTARQKYPQAALGYIVTMRVPALADDTAQRYYTLAQEICEKWDVACLNLFTDEEVFGWFADGAHLPDALHPDAGGYELLAPKIAAWMETLSVTVPGDCNGDGLADANDLTLLRQALLGLETATWRFNINHDDRIDIRDLVSLAQTL